MAQQRNQTDKRASTDDDPFIAGVPVPNAGEPVGASTSGASGDGLDIEPPPVPIWGGPTTASEAPARAGAVKTRRPVSWGQALILLAGLAALVFGVGAVILGGLAGSVTAPVVQVFTYDHTPLLGLIETGVGVVLILCAIVPGGRWIAGPVAVATIVGGALIIVQLDWIRENLAAEKRFGWVVIAVGAVGYLGAMVPTPRRVAVSRVEEDSSLTA